MYTQADGAWIKNAAEEARMVDTMRRGADMIVTGESGRGTKSTDRYALRASRRRSTASRRSANEAASCPAKAGCNRHELISRDH